MAKSKAFLSFFRTGKEKLFHAPEYLVLIILRLVITTEPFN